MDNSEMTLWYRQPAGSWNEALPCGNGRLGCMVFGIPAHERIQLNEDSLWSGGPTDRINPDSRQAVPVIRQLLREDRVQEAERLAVASLSGIPDSSRAYQTLGDLYLDFAGVDSIQDYRRALDLNTGIAAVSYISGGTRFQREVFAVMGHDVLVIAVHAEGPSRLTVHCRLDRDGGSRQIGCLGTDTTWYAGVTGEDGIAYCGMLAAGSTDGQVEATDAALTVREASFAVLYFTAATSFRTGDPHGSCLAQLDAARNIGFQHLRRDHIEAFAGQFAGMSLHLGESKDHIPTDERLAAYRYGASDPQLEALYFAYARYLLFSSSQRGTLPANLQGIWNDQYAPPWGSRFTININLEMNYWPACPCGLAQCEEPLFDLLARMAENGRKTAREMYGCRGFVAHHNTDLYGDTAPQDQYIPASYWVMGGAWLCTHIWRHYTYTRDMDFLRGSYAVLADAVQFFADFLQRDAEGFLATNPSVSPENTYILPDGTRGCLCIGPTMDNQLLRELLEGFLKASAALDIRDGLVERAERLNAQLHPTAVGRDGRLLEWAVEHTEAEPGHRHISHLYGLYPGRQISPDTPELFAAARKTLEARLAHGGGHTGWSRAWIIGLWARLRDGERAYTNLRTLLSESTFSNLMDNHPWGDGAVFQIDGNLGAAAAMVELLADSQEDRLVLLPALPQAWPQGSVTGLRLCGNATMCMDWSGHSLRRAEITANTEFSQVIEYGAARVALHLLKGETARLDGQLNIEVFCADNSEV